jgi:hypothetical protein
MPKPKSSRRKTKAQHDACGTTRPTRPRFDILPIVDSENWQPPKKPTWLTPTASTIWDEKVEQYRMRGQVVRGFEAALAQYASLEAKLIDAYSAGKTPQANLIQQHRNYCGAFFDTPSSTTVSVSKAGIENPFLKIAQTLRQQEKPTEN